VYFVEMSYPSLQRPELKTVGVEAGQLFLDKAIEYCIERYPELVSMLSVGIVPTVMLEATHGVRGSNIGRKTGSYRNADNSVATTDQTVLQFRDSLIASIIAADVPLSQASAATAHAGALAVLFPEGGKTTREKLRSSIESDTRAVMQMLTSLWPTEDIRLRMKNDDDLSAAFDRSDLIAWVRAFNKFCLNSSGNKFINAERAEKTLEACKMQGLDLPKYIKTFVKAAENVVTAGSNFNEYRIVSTFVRNLNQSEGVFKDFYADFLNKHKPTHALASKNLTFAVTYVQDHFQEVIQPEAARKKSESILINSTKEVESQLKQRGSAKGGSATVAFSVLATLLNDKRKAIDTAEAQRKKAAREAAGSKDKAAKEAAGSKATKTDEVSVSKSRCWRWAKDSTCSFGDKCKFTHATA
jgi:hypothetical protein